MTSLAASVPGVCGAWLMTAAGHQNNSNIPADEKKCDVIITWII